MAKLQEKKVYKVVIVGGGIAGLTLANALQKAKINYVLLESKPIIDPDLGASIGVLSS
jgi:2-polyprenyl-6-methoxyphenol hydroxylase-like FAD-dependent oxidoreductase